MYCRCKRTPDAIHRQHRFPWLPLFPGKSA
uniref:Uncharacterized protein n=1 Tax=Anguilla anguilla TaxID=7936 RepID=A0A0E9T8Z3_ANGAN